MRMDALPNVTPLLVADYLPPKDAVNFGLASKQLHSKLSLTVTQPRLILECFNQYDRDDLPHYGFQINATKSHVVAHSMVLSMRWRDQGWGNRKGRVIVVAKNEDEVRNEKRVGRRVIFSSDIAPHEFEELQIIFKPKEKESYHLWYFVGGGGGHGLFIEDVSD